MGTVLVSQFAMKKAVFEGSSEVLLYDPTVDQVEVLLEGLDHTCVAIPVTGSEICDFVSRAVTCDSISVIHLLGHGTPGGIYFSEFLLDQASWTSGIQNISGGLAGHSIQRINFWSCETGHGDIGMTFLKQVADTTGALVSGSDQKVGAADQGGSWELNQFAPPSAPFSDDSINLFDGVLSPEVIYDSIDANVVVSASGTVQDIQALLDGGKDLTGATITVSDSPHNILAVPESVELVVETFNLNSGTSSAISLDQVLELNSLVVSFPNNFPIGVVDDSVKIVQYFVSSNPAERLAVADADSIVATHASGTDLTPEQLSSLLSVDDLDLSDANSEIRVSGDASDYNAEIAANGVLNLLKADSMTVSDGDTARVELSTAQYKELSDSSLIANTLHFTISDSPANIDGATLATSDYTTVHSVTAVVESGDKDLTNYTNLAARVDSIDLASNTNVTVDVDQAGLVTGTGTYDVSDTASEIEAEAEKTNAGVLDNADDVSADATVTLTVAEYKALDDADTDLLTAYNIVDTEAEIRAEIDTSAPTAAGVLDGATAVQVVENPNVAPLVYQVIDLSVGELRALNTASVSLGSGYNIKDSVAGLFDGNGGVVSEVNSGTAVIVDGVINQAQYDALGVSNGAASVSAPNLDPTADSDVGGNLSVVVLNGDNNKVEEN